MIYLELFLTFLEIGAFTFGGGYAMLPLIREAVLLHGWIEEEALINFIAVSESTPGPFAINIATYVGNQVGGVFGSICATLGVVLPSFVIILIVAKCYEKFKESKTVKGIMSGLKPAVVGLIGAALFSLLLTVFFPAGVSFAPLATAGFWVSVGIFAAALLCAFKKVHPILIILGSAAIGIAQGYLL
ncbi:MAG: chromate transporter [Clostridia bacterium]|nr:chromate transporter [Clostridia bacterium]